MYTSTVLTFQTVTNAIVVLGLSLTDDGEMTRELTARLDRAIECYRAGAAQAIIVSGSHSFIEPEKAQFNEADRMADYIHRVCGHRIAVLEEKQADSIQNNLLMVVSRRNV